MMQDIQPILFRGATLVDPVRLTEGQGDLLVVDRKIAAVGGTISPPDGAKVIDAEGRVLSPAIIDAGVFKVDRKASIAGGVSTVVLMPDQSPPLDDPALVERAVRLGKPDLWVQPLAAATRGLNGRELAELGLMREAGAVGVATGRTAIADAKVMLRLLRYVAGLGQVVVAHGEEPMLTSGAVATDGEMATRLGLASAPAAAEALQIGRDIRLAEIAGAALHIPAVTTAEGVALVRAAKARGQNVTAATTPSYLMLNDQAMYGFRTYTHLSPPLRSEEDRLAVRAGVADGTIDMIGSRHDPRTSDEKRQPFIQAKPGVAGMVTLLPLALTLVADDVISLPRLMQMLSTNPAKRFGLPGGRLDIGAPADLVLFDPGAPWRIDAHQLAGLAGNTPFDGLPVMGKVDMLVKGGEPLSA